jgi:hypothetical protein
MFLICSQYARTFLWFAACAGDANWRDEAMAD